ncbi:MAG: hypothetical protein ACKVT2_03500 [Saprospiraceae bacterium]
MEVYDENLSIKAALAELFRRFGFPDDAYTAKWFVVGVGKFLISLPNIPSRVRVAKFHDIHHILTGYPANWRGEAQIGAWEIATGCRSSFVAWFLNGVGVLIGLFICPKEVWRAFKRGWRTKTNLYYDFDYESLMRETVKGLRERIGLAEV